MIRIKCSMKFKIFLIVFLILSFTELSGSVYSSLDKEQSQITCNLPFSSASVGTPIGIFGYISPIRLANVTIQISNDNGTIWNTLAVILTNYNGNYSYLWFPTAGEYLVRAFLHEDKDFLNATSPAQIIIVSKTLSKITCELSSYQVVLGENVTIMGAITPTFSGEQIIIFMSNDEIHWEILTTVDTASGGNYLYIWNTTRTGNFYFKASWLGNDVFIGAESLECKIIVKEEQDLTIYFVLILILATVIAGYFIIKKKER